MSIGAGLFPANTLIPLQRLQSLAFGKAPAGQFWAFGVQRSE